MICHSTFRLWTCILFILQQSVDWADYEGFSLSVQLLICCSLCISIWTVFLPLCCVPPCLKLMPECLCRPGVLGGNMGNYPWLADSWPTTNLVHSGKEAVNCCTANHDTAERYYNGRMLLDKLIVLLVSFVLME